MGLGDEWQCVLKDYEPITSIGQGSYGNVVKCRCLKTGNYRAIKHLRGFSDHEYSSIQVLREIQILKAIKN